MSHPTLLESRPEPVPQLGRYRLLEVLGQGGMGTIYLAARKAAGEYPALYALKALRPELARDSRHVDMFTREADLAARLCHPNVVRTVEVGEDRGRAFLVMEFLDGQPFHRLLGSEGQIPLLPLCARLQIVCAALYGLHYVHQLHDNERPLNLVHRDVSPHNLFVTYEGQVKLLDFGVAKLANQGDSNSADFKGKLGYAAPERFVGSRVDVRSDVFAAGVSLWEAIALRRFASGPITRAYVEARLHGRELPITQAAPDIDPQLAAICNRALQVDPERRFQSAEALRRALEDYLLTHHAQVDCLTLGRWVQHRFGPERNALHQRVNVQLRAMLDQEPELAAPEPAPPVVGRSFIRRRPETAPEGFAAASLKRGRRNVLWLSTLLLLATLAAVVHAAI